MLRYTRRTIGGRRYNMAIGPITAISLRGKETGEALAGHVLSSHAGEFDGRWMKVLQRGHQPAAQHVARMLAGNHEHRSCRVVWPRR